jgi:broad specificity phosphatase PhoE
MSGKVHIVRHTEGLHNLRQNPNIQDAPLSERGFDRAEKLGKRFIELQSNKVGEVISSPLRRAIQTSLLAFQRVLDEANYPPGSGQGVKDGMALVLNADLQEISDQPCNTGSRQADLKSWFPALEHQIDGLDPNWFKKQGPLSPTNPTQLAARKVRILNLIQATLQRAEAADADRKDVVVVAHEGTIALITPTGTVVQMGEWATFTMESQPGGGVILK